MLNMHIWYAAACYFMIYAGLGWVLEVIYQAAAKGNITNRGFLNGPVCPVYGLGSLAVLAWEESLPGEPPAYMIFLCGILLATVIELAAGWILDKLFHARWWDYSDLPYNFHGYICPLFSLLWGIAVFVGLKGIHPAVEILVENLLSLKYGPLLLIPVYLAFFADLIVTVTILIGLNRRFAELDAVRSEMRRFSDDLSTEIGTRARTADIEMKNRSSKAAANLKEAAIETREGVEYARDAGRRQLEEKRQRMKEELLKKATLRRILRAFPELSHHDFPDLFADLRQELEGEKKQ